MAASSRPGLDLAKLRDVKLRELAIRFAFGAVIAVAAGVLGKVVGERFAGTFLAFPAILPATLTLIQEKEGARRADKDAIGAVLGGLALACFAGVAELTWLRLPAAASLVVAFAAWLITAGALYAVLCFLYPAACDDGEPEGHDGPDGQSGSRPVPAGRG